MRIFFFLLLASSCLACTGCATVGKTLFDSDDCEIDPYILKRKGIEPGSKRHRKLVAQETMYRDFRRRAHAPKDSSAFTTPPTFEELIRSSH